MASPPLLPWEVIERVIGHSGNRPRTLRHFSLTCHALRPRALCLLVSNVHFKCRVKIFDFCDFLQAKPHLKPLVHSIAVDPDEFAPFPLLSILPNLQRLKFGPTQPIKPEDRAATVLNRSSLTCCGRFGTHIQAIHLSDLSFATYLDLARVLLAFTNLNELACSRVIVQAGGNQAHLDVLKRHLSERLHLRTVNIDYLQLDEEHFFNRSSVAALLLDSEPGLVQSTVETLTVRPYRSYGLSRVFEWPRLRSLVLNPRFITREITATIVFLKHSPPSIQDVRVQFRDGLWTTCSTLSGEASSGQLKELEQVLLRFRRPRIACLVYALHDAKILFWTQEIGQHFPELCQRGLFTITPRIVVPGAGHDDTVQDLATSPDGKWVATGSSDCTVILWDAAVGTTVAQQWVAHGYNHVSSLVFSPDSRYLLSGGWDSTVKIWDVAEGPLRQVTMLEGHTNRVTCCAWSPHDSIVVASGSDDQSVRLWDVRAFRALHVLEHPDGHCIRLVAFSPDGRWLVSGSSRGYHLWNTASGTLHKSLLDGGLILLRAPAAVFDPTSARLLVADSDHMVKVVDVETREERGVLREWNGARSVSFSPDGTLVLTGFSDGRVMLRDAFTGVKLLLLEGHKKQVLRACFSPCGKYVASASEDGTVRLWRTKDGSCVATFSQHQSWEVLHVAFCPEGETLWSADMGGQIVMWRIRDIDPSNEPAC